MKKKHNIFSKKGSFIFEIAITAPVFLILIFFVLHLITCIRAETLLLQAVDQVTSEIAAAAPLVSVGTDLIQDVLQRKTGSSDTEKEKEPSLQLEQLAKGAGEIGAVLEALDIDAGDLIGTLLFGETVRNRIVSYYNLYKKDNTIGKMDLISDLSVYLDINNDEKVIYIRGYYKRKSLFGMQERQIKSAVALYSPIQITMQESKETDEDEKNEVWELDNFQRGKILRNEHGGNLPANYPVIASWENNMATAIKSIDLTAPSYQKDGSVKKTISGYIRDFADFDGTDKPWGKDKIDISRGMIHRKKLIIVIPGNYTESAYQELLSCEKDARDAGIEISWVIYGESYKYIKKETGESGTVE